MVTGSLPGRPGNLTNDQEAKLRELWKASLKVFGVSQQGGSAATNGVKEGDSVPSKEGAQDAHAAIVGSEKKKKKRINMFGRKKDDGTGDEDAGTDHPEMAKDPEDKYGQTKEFHKAIATSTPEELRTAFWGMVKHDHPDGLLLRFLRARKWDVQKALVMMVSTMHWRMAEMHVDDDIIKHGEAAALDDSRSSDKAVSKEGSDFLMQMRLGKSYLHGTDKEGRPMCFVNVRLHKQGDQSEHSLERYTVYLLETARLFLEPPVDTATVIFDMTSFSMANMDYTPVKFMIKCFEANYPESLGVVLVHKSPWIFQGIWKIIKGWLDPVVAGKVNFTNNVEELEKFIARDHIPEDFGGTDPWNYLYIEPISGENAKMQNAPILDKLEKDRAKTVMQFESVTLEWANAANDSKDHHQKRNEIAEQLKSGYWKIDPYIRARTLYDRVGVIKEGGKVDFYAKPPPKEEIPVQSNGPAPPSHQPGELD